MTCGSDGGHGTRLHRITVDSVDTKIQSCWNGFPISIIQTQTAWQPAQLLFTGTFSRISNAHHFLSLYFSKPFPFWDFVRYPVGFFSICCALPNGLYRITEFSVLLCYLTARVRCIQLHIPISTCHWLLQWLQLLYQYHTHSRVQ